MNGFEKIGAKHGTDKISQHGYHRFYPLFLEPLRKKKIKMLEIGIEHKNSLKLWLEYFPKAFVYGIDKDVSEKGKRYQIFKCRQEDRQALEDLNLIHLDFIIDDGSHVPEHQLESFNYLFRECLKPGGIYIIEDVETSYWRNGSIYHCKVSAGYKKQNSIVEIFKSAADEVNKEFLPGEDWIAHNESHQVYQDVRDQIGTITFCQNTIIIQKKDLSYEKFDNREYKWKAAANKKNLVVYQSFFSERTKHALDPGFIPYNNTGQLTELYENQILLDIFQHQKEKWASADYTGLVSWRFFEKTELTSQKVFSRIEAEKNKKQVYLLTPERYIGRFQSVFSPAGFPAVTELCRLVDQARILPFELQHRNTGPIISFCNFWLATPEIFSDYIENYLQPVVNFLQQNKSKELRKVLAGKVNHNYRPHPPHAFFLEGLFQCYLHYKNFTYDYIPDKRADQPISQLRSQRSVEFGPGTPVDNLIAMHA